MKHIFVDPPQPADFYRDTGIGTFRWVHKMNDKHPLRQIHNALLTYWNLPKMHVERRHALLLDIADKCNRYAGSKPAEKQTSPKITAVKQCALNSVLRVMLERERAENLAKDMQGAQAPNTVRVGNPQSHSVKNDYERLNKPGTPGIKGDVLVDQAEFYFDIKPTGDPNVDYYTMKKVLSHMKKSGKHTDDIELLYMNEATRGKYALSFDKQGYVRYVNGGLLQTRGGIDEIIYAFGKDRVMHAGSVEEIRASTGLAAVHHSSFYAGGDVLCAGTVGVDATGHLQYISNGSGHYGPPPPALYNCLDIVAADLGRWVDQAYALVFDFRNYYGTHTYRSGRKVSLFMIPMGEFLRTRTLVPQVGDFAVIQSKTENKYTYDIPLRAWNRGARLFMS
ncbi:MAG: hypothetical protein SFV18_00635 [Bryobacteraceae bacterium]|nr:hypothetical protein [Bryobacteraceae bacterium]